MVFDDAAADEQADAHAIDLVVQRGSKIFSTPCSSKPTPTSFIAWAAIRACMKLPSPVRADAAPSPS